MSIGVDGILVSNHGGRQIEALPPPIDCVPAIVAGGRRPRHRAVRLRRAQRHRRGARAGARRDAAFAGKAFLWGLGALGADGPGHVIDLLIDELQSALGQIGALLAGRGAQRQGPASGRAALLICARGRMVMRRGAR